MKTLITAVVILYTMDVFSQIEVELAGRVISNYPFFTQAMTFNSDEPVYVAVDYSLYPEIAGVHNVYIVEDKNETEWNSDPSLVDVSPGGTISPNFTSLEILNNTFLLENDNTWSASPEMGIGHGYDVVIDMDGNQELSAPDFIDGMHEAGFYVVGNITEEGPFEVITEDFTGSTSLTKRVYYPANIDELGTLPLIIVSHGWTHNYTYYDYLGEHIASYGYVVMSHWNDVGSGNTAATNSSSLSMISNIDHLLSQQSTLFNGVLDGKMDSHHMGWIGHSTGGECVVRAYTRLHNGENISEYFTWQDVSVISSICPVSWMSGDFVNPHHVNYHQFIGGADTDVSGFPYDSYDQPMSIYERGTGNKQLTYLHGAGHGMFHNDEDAWPWEEGPDLIDREQVHPVVKSYFLALVELYIRSNPAAKDFFTRNYFEFHPMGIDPVVIISNEYKDASFAEKLVIDDFQDEADLNISSAGWPVETEMNDEQEILMQDIDESLDFDPAQPSNGMTRARYNDNPRCLVFSWSSNGGITYYTPENPPDFSEYEFLSFRACQLTRNPLNDILDDHISFTVRLNDSQGSTSSINTHEYGQITRTYQRDGGWQNEFVTIRIPIIDFLTNGSDIDLTQIVAIDFNFGEGLGSIQGALGFDDLELVKKELNIPSGVNEITSEKNNMLIYPNPAAEYFNVTSSNGITEIKITDLTGKLLREISAPSTTYTQVNISDIAPGIYGVRLSGQNMVAFRLLLIE